MLRQFPCRLSVLLLYSLFHHVLYLLPWYSPLPFWAICLAYKDKRVVCILFITFLIPFDFILFSIPVSIFCQWNKLFIFAFTAPSQDLTLIQLMLWLTSFWNSVDFVHACLEEFNFIIACTTSHNVCTFTQKHRTCGKVFKYLKQLCFFFSPQWNLHSEFASVGSDLLHESIFFLSKNKCVCEFYSSMWHSGICFDIMGML